MGRMSFKELLNADVSTLFTKRAKNKEVKTLLIDYKKPVVVFDIGQKDIKVLVGKKQKENLVVQKTFTIQTPTESLLDGKVLSEAILANALENGLKEQNIKIKDALVTVNSSQIINRELIIDKVEVEELETVVRYELQQYLPINLNDYQVQFIILDEFEDEEGFKYKIFVIAFPERIAKSYYQLLKIAGVKPLSLETTFTSLNKLLSHTMMINEKPFNSKDVVAFLDLGATTIDVHIFKDGHIDLTRMIKSGGDDIDQMLSYRHQIPLKSISKVKQNLDLMGNIEDELVQTTRLAVDNLISEIDRILQFYRNKSYRQIDHIYLYGGGAVLKGIDRYMSQQLNLNVETIKSWNDIKIDGDLANFINTLGSMYKE